MAQVLRVEKALAAGVADVELLQLLRRAPVVVPDDKGGLEHDCLAGAQPAVAEVVVFGRLGRPKALVERTGCEHGIAREHHVIREQGATVPFAREVVRLGCFLRRRHCAWVADRQHPPRDDRRRVRFVQTQGSCDPVRRHRAVVVGDEHDVVGGGSDAVVAPPSDAVPVAGHDAGPDRRERAHDRHHLRVVALIYDEHLRRTGVALGHRPEALAQRSRPPDSRDHDRDRKRADRVRHDSGSVAICHSTPGWTTLSRSTEPEASSARGHTRKRSASSFRSVS